MTVMTVSRFDMLPGRLGAEPTRRSRRAARPRRTTRGRAWWLNWSFRGRAAGRRAAR